MRMMQINLDEDGLPERFTAELTREEGVFLALLLGSQNDPASDQVMAGGSAVRDRIYDSLTGDMFNRFYDDGVDGAL